MGASLRVDCRVQKVVDKTKWIWQLQLIRQRLGDLFQTRRKKKSRRSFLLSPRRLLIMSLSPLIKLSMSTDIKQRAEITTLYSLQIKISPANRHVGHREGKHVYWKWQAVFIVPGHVQQIQSCNELISRGLITNQYNTISALLCIKPLYIEPIISNTAGSFNEK